MLFGGLQKNSFIDYPGRLSCVLFLSGCNFECPYCHNPDLVNVRSQSLPYLSGDRVYEFLESRRGLLEGVVISGGEPTLHKDLSPLCERLKRMGYSVKLDTNGSRPRVIERLIAEELIDYIAMDIKTDPCSYSRFVKRDCNPNHILESVRIIMDSGKEYEFRTTCVKPIVDGHVVGRIARIIDGAMLYALQGFHSARVLNPEFCEGNGARYNDREIMAFKSVAEPWVKKCIVRG